MYIQRIIQQALPGRAQEHLALCEEHTRAMQAAGSLHSLAMRMFTREPGLVTSIQHESLAAFQAYQERNATDAAYQERIRKIGACVARGEQELFETLLPAQPTITPAYSLRIKFFPQPGKGPALRGELEGRIRPGVSGPIGAGLGIQVAPPDGAAFVITILFANLAGMDAWRAAQAADPTFQAFVARTGSLTARANQQEMLRILLPFPRP